MPDEAASAVAFARVLRGAGLAVAPGSTVVFAEAMVALDDAGGHAAYWAGRATLVHRPEDIPEFDRCFERFFGLAPGGTSVPVGAASPTATSPELEVVVAHDDAPQEPAADDASPVPRGTPVLAVRWSRAEILRHRDFTTYTAAEFDEARRLMADLEVTGAPRRSRRLRRSRAARGRPDLRRTVRRSLRTGGEPISRAFAAPSTRPRRVVLLCDVSGSMEPYARALVRFLHTAVAGRGGVEAFALGTRLTRITRELSSRDPDAAIASAARRVVDWAGGTRLGDGLRAFNDEWGVRGLAHGAVVVVLSDGWDRGDAGVLGEQMARLRRVAHRVVWVNPLKVTDGYTPTTQGMAAALPYVDEFVEGHSVASLEHLVAVISR